MHIETVTRLEYLLGFIPARLSAIGEPEFSRQPAPGKWSKKQIIGHLVDSAANNHQRFIRVQYEDVPVICYDQNKWNELCGYADMDGLQLINLWAVYNWFLVGILKRVPAEALHRQCNSGDTANHTLEWLIADYVKHMEHHLHQVIDY